MRGGKKDASEWKPPNPDEVLRRMLKMPPKSHKPSEKKQKEEQ